MPEAETTTKRGPLVGGPDPAWSPEVAVRPAAVKSRRQILPFLLTLAAIAVATPLVWAMWSAYMGAPWTRDATVRAYVVTIAPEVAGRVVELPVADNQLVHKGDLLMVIDPTDYKITVARSEAVVRQARINADKVADEEKRRRK